MTDTGAIAALKADGARFDADVDNIRAAADHFAGAYAQAASAVVEMTTSMRANTTALLAQADQLNARANALGLPDVCTVPDLTAIFDQALADTGVQLPFALTFKAMLTDDGGAQHD
jgi:hypothetical protein